MAYKVQDWIDAKQSIDRSNGQTRYQESELEIARSYHEAICQGKIHVRNLIQELEKYISNENDLIVVSRALALLPAILQWTPILSKHDIHFLIDYFVKRIRNEENNIANNAGLGEIITVFKLLIEHTNFDSKDSIFITSSIFTLADDRIRFKNLPEFVRKDTYSVIDKLFREYSSEISKELGHDQLVEGLLQLTVFEKKASCLVIIFPLISHISQNWDLTSLNLERLFASYMRYFPIKVGGLQNEAARVSQEMSICLSDCLVSNDSYASMAFPHLIENLENHATLSAANLHEVFVATDKCVQNYTPQTVALWFSRLWEALKFQVWNGENEETITESLKILHSIALSLDRERSNLSQENSSLTQYTIQIATECRDRISDSPQRYLLSTGKILYTVGSSSQYMFQLVIKNILPSLMTLWRSMTLGSEKKNLLRVINFILRAGIELLDSSNELLDQGVVNVVQSLRIFQEGLLVTFSNAIVELKRATFDLSGSNKNVAQDANFFVPVLEGISLLFKVPSYLTGVEKGMMVQELVQITTNTPKDSVIHNEGLLALRLISTSQPTVFVEMIIPTMMENLPESLTPDARSHIKDLRRVASYLDDIAEISCFPCKKELDSGIPRGAISCHWQRNFDCFVEHLLKKIGALFLLKNQVSYAKAIIATLLKGLKMFDGALEPAHISQASPQPRILSYEFLWCQILDKVLTSDHYPMGHPFFNSNRKHLRVKTLPHQGDKIDESLLELVGNILLQISRSKLNTPENNIVVKFFGTLTDSAIKDHPFYFEEFFAQPLIFKSDPPKNSMVCLVLVYPLIGIQGDSSDDKFLSKIKMHLGINEKVSDLALNTIYEILNLDNKITARVRIHLLYYVQVMVAKFHCSRDRLKDGKTFIDAIESLIKNHAVKPQQYIEHFFQVIAYLSTASFTCYDRNLMSPLFNLLCEGLNSEIYSSQTCNLVSHSFRMLLANSHILSQKNCIQVRSLRKGFILELVVSLLNQHRALSLSKPCISFYKYLEAKANYIKAIMGVFGHVEHTMVLEKFDTEELVELALDGTNVSNDDWAKAECIKLVHVLIRVRPDFMQKYVNRIIERMIERTHNTLERPSDANVECRVLGLEVLRLLIEKFSTSLEAQSRRRLMAELAIAKDDCHIYVRQAAAQCSLAWIYVKS